MPRRGGGGVGVVTDSTACLPAELGDGATLLRVVPLNVTIGDVTCPEDEIGPDAVAAAQEQGIAVRTSRPSPARFLDAYRDLAAAGCSSLVSVHASEALSSTVSSARLAAMEADVPVGVVDSRTLGMALGFGTLAALRWARSGAEPDEVAAAARATCASSRTAFYVDSLEPLRRGGRIGRAGALFGSALSIKPLLQVCDGAITPLARVRSRGKAVERLGSWALARAEELPRGAPVCAVHSLQHADLADLLVERLVTGRSQRGQSGTVETPHESAPCEPAGSSRVGVSSRGGDGSGTGVREGDAAVSDDGEDGGALQAADGCVGSGDASPVWSLGPVRARLGAVVTAHVGAGAVAAVVASMPQPHPEA